VKTLTEAAYNGDGGWAMKGKGGYVWFELCEAATVDATSLTSTTSLIFFLCLIYDARQISSVAHEALGPGCSPGTSLRGTGRSDSSCIRNDIRGKLGTRHARSLKSLDWGKKVEAMTVQST
jgi:hypothetical protein